jgi:hypothetical protein
VFSVTFKLPLAWLALWVSCSPAVAEPKRVPPERLQLRQGAQLYPESRDGNFSSALAVPSRTIVETLQWDGAWHLVKDPAGRSRWVRSRLLEPVGSCHEDQAAQFRFLARHFGFIANDERFETVGLSTGAVRSVHVNRNEPQLSHSELSLKMGLARYEPGTAALLYYHGASAACALLVDRNGIVAYEIVKRTTPQVDEAVHQYLASVIPQACLSGRAPHLKRDTRAPNASRSAEGCDLSKSPGEGEIDDKEIAQILFPAAIERALGNYKNIIVVPYGTLAIVPFAAVRLPATSANFADRLAYTLAPAFTQIGIGKGIHLARQGVSARPSAVVVGNPSYDDPEWTMPDLPGAEAEARAVANLLKVQPLLNQAATLDNLRGQLDRAKPIDVVYLATHGIATDDDPESLLRDGTSRSFVALAAGERLSTDTLNVVGYKGSRLVVLSACLTGRGWISEFGTVGLPRLFHLKGAEEVVMSLWQVDDRATHLLMSTFMAEYLKAWPKSSAATALRKAALDVRKTYPRPAFWAAFSVFGVGPFN